MNEFHKFVDWNFILYKACIEPEMTPDDYKILETKGLLKPNDNHLSMLQDAPEWLKKWTSMICQFIDFEEKEMVDVFRKQMMLRYPNENLFEYEFV